jgi:hypothetical protein
MMKKLNFALLSLVAVSFLMLSGCRPTSAESTETHTDVEMQEAAILSHHQALGDSLVQLAQAELLRNVSQAMAEGGAPNAIDFCNIHAGGIVAKLAEEWNCTLRRTSLQYRNPEARPNEAEENLLNWYAGLPKGEWTSTVWREENLVHYASPIQMAMPACLQCHGIPGSDISEGTMAVILENYPEDKATGYQAGDLRGMWHLTFDPEMHKSTKE